MIAVIADDISGAAELAGAALRHGLRAEVQTVFDPGTDADVICVDTDTRSMAEPEAAQAAGEAARRVAAARPEWIYKKCDSVLRGHVLAELRAIMAATGRSRAVLVPANPSRGRVIRGGRLLVNDVLLSETAFARDPEHPRRTSHVADLLGGDLSGVMIPDAESEAHLAGQVALVDDGTLAGGGVDFFEALLAARGWALAGSGTGSAPDDRRSTGPGEKNPLPVTLMVCGSAASWSLRRQQASLRGVPLFSLPLQTGEIAGTLRSNRCALIGVGDGPATAGASPSLLVRKLAEASARVLRETTVTRILLEGGATAAAVVRELGWTRLRACEASAPGIGTLQPLHADAPVLSIKPGSYDWPPGSWP